MLAAAAWSRSGGRRWRRQVIPSLAIALALILDTADGHLARLQGTASDFGRWLDANLDELGDMALHAAIAWSAYARSGRPGWLLVGMAYAMAKYLFIFGDDLRRAAEGRRETARSRCRPGRVRRLAHLAGHADVRWHALDRPRRARPAGRGARGVRGLLRRPSGGRGVAKGGPAMLRRPARLGPDPRQGRGPQPARIAWRPSPGPTR